MKSAAPNDRRITRLSRLLAAALVCLYAAAIIFTLARGKAVDFNLYYLAAHGFAQGEDIYAIGAQSTPASVAAWKRLASEVGIIAYAPPYRYPPLTAVLVWPLTYLSPRAAAAVWLAASALALIASAWLLGRTGTTRGGVPLALALLAGFVPALVTLYAGQVNAFVLLSLCWALHAATRGRLEHAGASLAVGATLKLVPLGHLAYLGWRKQWTAVGAGLAVIVVCMVAPLPLVGWRGLLSYAHSFVALSEVESPPAVSGNQALSGLLAQLLDADASQLWWLTQICSVALVAATVVSCRPFGPLAGTFNLEFALVTVTVTLVPPYVWYHQLVLLLLPLFVLLDCALTDVSERWMVLPLGLSYGAIAAFGVAWRLFTSPIMASLPAYAAILIWALLARLILKSKRRVTSPGLLVDRVV